MKSMAMLRGGLLFGLLSLFAGCAQPVSDVDGEDVGEVQQANGDDKNNGLDTVAWNHCKYDLVQAMNVSIFVPGDSLNSALPASVTDGDCVEAFEKAKSCAASLTTAQGWPHSALPIGAKEEVMACVAALVNEVDDISVCIDGPNVVDGGYSDCYSHTIDEAVWQVEIDRFNRITVNVWPQHPEVACTSSQVKNALGERFCLDPGEDNLEACGLKLQEDFEGDCTVQGGNVTCFGEPAISSALTIGGWRTLWMRQGCDPIPQ